MISEQSSIKYFMQEIYIYIYRLKTMENLLNKIVSYAAYRRLFIDTFKSLQLYNKHSPIS